MVKKSEINKKGRLAKSTLSVVLAASMVLTSSSFVWAAPVEPVAVMEEGDTSGTVDIPIEETATTSIDMQDLMVGNEEIVGAFQDVDLGEISTKSDLDAAVKATVPDSSTSTKLNQYFGDSDWEITVDGIAFSDAYDVAKLPFTNGLHTIVITSATNAQTTTSVTYTVKLAASEVSININNNADLAYRGVALEPEVLVSYDGADLSEGTDYSVTFANNTNAYNLAEGESGFSDAKAPKATITFKNNYATLDPISKYFKIAPFDLANAEIDALIDQTFTYNGEVQVPAVKGVKVKLDALSGTRTPLVNGTDFDIRSGSSSDYDSADPATMGKDANDYYGWIVAKEGSNYTGKKQIGKYTIEPKALTASSVSVTSKPVVSGKVSSKAELEKLITVTDTVTGKKLTSTNYEIKYENKSTTIYADDPTSSALVDYGTYNIRIELKTGGNYTAAANTYVYGTYTVNGESLAALTVKSLGTAVNKDPETDEYYFVFNGSKDGQAPNSLEMSEGASVTAANPSNAIFTAEFPNAEDCVNVGTYEIKLTGRNKYAGQTTTVKFAIRPKTISTGMITTYNSITHTGDAATPYAVVKDVIDGKNVILTPGTDYSASVNTATKNIEITGMGNYTTKTDSATFVAKSYPATANKTVDLNSPAIKAEVKGTYSYTGSQITPAASDIVVTEVGSTSTYLLVKDRDYTVSYKDNINVGTAYVVLTGKGDFAGSTREVAFEITGPEVSSLYKLDTTAITKTEFPYTGTSQESVIKTEAAKAFFRDIATNARKQPKEIKYYRDNKEIKNVTDEFTTPGTITAEYSMENTSGTLTAVFSIVGKPLSEVATIGDKIADQQYTGQEIKPAVTITAKDGVTILKEGRDYTVEYKNNINVGEAYAIINGAGNYDGAYLVTFNIVGTEIKDAVVTAENVSYTGEALTPAVTVKLGDKALVAGTDFIAEYKDNTNAGTATVTITGVGGYQGTASATFTIAKADQKLSVSKAAADALKIRNTNANTYTLKVDGASTKLSYESSNTKVATVNSAGKLSFKHVCGKATITVTAAADDNHNAATLKVAVAVKPATPKITITARAKGFNAKATAVKDITGYQVGYSTDKNFTASKTNKKLVVTTKALNKNFSGLSAKKGYYVRVRAYKKVGSTVYWGNWTSAKKITTK